MKVTMVPALFASLLVGGCASSTLSKDECRSVDWRTIGYEDLFDDRRRGWHDLIAGTVVIEDPS